MDIQIDIRDLRSRLKWKRSDLANYLGLDLSTVSRLENGQTPNGSTNRLLQLLNYASVDRAFLNVLTSVHRGEDNAFKRAAAAVSRKFPN